MPVSYNKLFKIYNSETEILGEVRGITEYFLVALFIGPSKLFKLLNNIEIDLMTKRFDILLS